MKKLKANVVLSGNLGSVDFAISTYRIEDGCAIFTDYDKNEQSVFPLSSIICFCVKEVQQ